MSARTFDASKPGRYGNVTVIEDRHGLSVVLHRTVVARLSAGTVTLDSGGWRTPTTKTAINNALRQWGCDCRIWQEKHEWFIDAKVATTRPATLEFRDGMEIDAHSARLVGLKAS